MKNLNVIKENNILKTKKMISKYGLFIAFVLILITLSITSPAFLKPSNLINILRQMTTIGILGMGMAILIIMGQIDLSVGSTVALAAVIGGLLVQNNAYPTWLGILATIATGVVVGLVNGIIIAKGKVPAFLVTMAMMTIARGSAMICASGMPISNLSDSFNYIGSALLFDILPLPVIVYFIIFTITALILKKTKLGRYIYAIGGNEQAAIVAGINIDRVKIKGYLISGAYTGLAGFMLASRLKAAPPTVGNGYELDAIASCVIGGISFNGGIGSVFGGLLGILLIGTINNGLDLLNVQTFVQQIVKGVIIIIAILLDRKKN
jgi:ribose/xylose/arabinose/galactoside ABC-type transport system permease subunit